MAGDLGACVQILKLRLQFLLSVNFIVILVKQLPLDEAAAASIPTSQEAGQDWQHQLGGVRREDVEGQSHAECGTHVPVPLDGKVVVLSVEDWDESKYHFVF